MMNMLGSRVVVTFRVLVILSLALSLALAGCGGTDESGGEAAPATSAASPQPTATAEPQGEWTTVVTLRSNDPTNEIGLLVSEEFTVTGEARFVLDMPDGGETDGVIAAILPADQEITVDSALEAESVLLAGAVPEEVVGGLDGTYVMFVSVPTDLEWSIEVQTKS